ncbi:MAG: acetyl-CoA carboxylase biotin carboxyl carrier protein [Pirellulales bacterium]
MGADEPRQTDADVFHVGRIRRLVELMEQHGLSEVDLRHQDQRIKLRRGGSEVVVPQIVAPTAAPPMAAPPVSPPMTAAGSTGSGAAGGGASDANTVLIRSPMVGTFYSRPNPDSESFVKIGQMVSPDTTVCIIEAMKVFNEIAAEVSGKVVAVLVDNEEPVEYGKPLFKVELSK